MPAPQIAFAASTDFVDLDDSWPPLRAELERVGVQAHVIPWDAAGSDIGWGDFDLVAANYTWGYVVARDRFLEWAGRVSAATRLVNPLPHLAWSSDKTYLADLDEAGIPVVPTVWVAPGDDWEPPGGDDGYVVKPTVASGGMGAARYRTGDPVHQARGHVDALHEAGHTAMVQPYQSSVDRSGETALVYLGGALSHALRKGPLLRPGAGVVERLWEQQVITPATASGAERALGEAVMAAVGERLGPTSYGRVDMVPGPLGDPVVLEVELVEPALFLQHSEGSASRFASVLRDAL
ncbi:MAG TPA: hypothetical protein VFH58_06850 [Acidimicrobiales bacterium]|nr:hypothetical protein [Acidimicrobiales bacterium]